MAARWPLAPDESRVAADTGVRLIVFVAGLCGHLRKEGDGCAVLAQDGRAGADVADGAGRDGHIRFRNIERLHLRQVDVTGRAADVVVCRCVAKLERQPLRPSARPCLEPSDGVGREHAGQNGLRGCGAFLLRILALRKMATGAVVLQRLL